MPRQALTPLSQQPNLPASQALSGPVAQQQQQACDLPQGDAEQQKHSTEPEVVVHKRGRRKASGSSSAKARSTQKRTLVEMLEEVKPLWPGQGKKYRLKSGYHMSDLDKQEVSNFVDKHKREDPSCIVAFTASLGVGGHQEYIEFMEAESEESEPEPESIPRRRRDKTHDAEGEVYADDTSDEEEMRREALLKQSQLLQQQIKKDSICTACRVPMEGERYEEDRKHRQPQLQTLHSTVAMVTASLQLP